MEFMGSISFFNTVFNQTDKFNGNTYLGPHPCALQSVKAVTGDADSNFLGPKPKFTSLEMTHRMASELSSDR